MMAGAAGGRFAGRVVLISGGAGGMGQSHARRFAAEGARVVIGDIDHAAGAALAEELKGAAIFAQLDVTNEESWAEAVDAAERAFGPVSILIHNAGIVDAAPIDRMEAAIFRRIMDVNHTGAFLGLRAVVPSMRKVTNGTIVNISSVTGFAAVPGLSAYACSKHALVGLTKAAALDLAADNIRVNCVHPGIIDTPMLGDVDSIKPQRQPIRRIGTPDEVSNVVLFLASEEASFCTGSSFVVDGGFLTVVGDPA